MEGDTPYRYTPPTGQRCAAMCMKMGTEIWLCPPHEKTWLYCTSAYNPYIHIWCGANLICCPLEVVAYDVSMNIVHHKYFGGNISSCTTLIWWCLYLVWMICCSVLLCADQHTTGCMKMLAFWQCGHWTHQIWILLCTPLWLWGCLLFPCKWFPPFWNKD